MVKVDSEIKNEIIEKHLKYGRTQTSLASEYGLSRGVVSRIIKAYREECQRNELEASNLKMMEENRLLKAKNEELEKEVDFLKKAAAFFVKGN